MHIIIGVRLMIIIKHKYYKWFEKDKKVHTLNTLKPCIPRASWFTLMISLFCNISLNSGRTADNSLDISKGAANTAQMAICDLLWSMVRPKLPIKSWKCINKNSNLGIIYIAGLLYKHEMCNLLNTIIYSDRK